MPQKQPLATLDLRKVREVHWQSLAIRFAFGAAISVTAGAVGLVFGTRVGGMLLAFPAILPATLTLIAKEEGEERSFHDLQGTVAGAVGLVGFAAVASETIGRTSIYVALSVSLLAWCLVAGGLYLVWARWLRSRGVEL